MEALTAKEIASVNAVARRTARILTVQRVTSARGLTDEGEASGAVSIAGIIYHAGEGAEISAKRIVQGGN